MILVCKTAMRPVTSKQVMYAMCVNVEWKMAQYLALECCNESIHAYTSQRLHELSKYDGNGTKMVRWEHYCYMTFTNNAQGKVFIGLSTMT